MMVPPGWKLELYEKMYGKVLLCESANVINELGCIVVHAEVGTPQEKALTLRICTKLNSDSAVNRLHAH